MEISAHSIYDMVSLIVKLVCVLLQDKAMKQRDANRALLNSQGKEQHGLAHH